MNLRTDKSCVNGAYDLCKPTESRNTQALRTEIRALRAEIERLRKAVRSPNVPENVDVETAAECLGISERTLRSYLADQTIQSVKIGRRRLIPIDALHEFVKKRLDG
jgi:excisionase family DNA binding protein